ncbi:HipA domain-containing protein [bacterium]
MKFIPLQQTNEIINISNWQNIKPYEEGSKPKQELFSPKNVLNQNIQPNHRYINKYSTTIHDKKHREQFWIEIFAYYFAALIDIKVPKTFLSIDKDKKNGALTEWFYLDRILLNLAFKISNEQKLSYNENIIFIDDYISGYNFMNAKIENFDMKKGTKHNLQTLFDIMKDEKVDNWLELWIKYFVFDSLIGNTDRHQDNWGILYCKDQRFLSPAFDNGTSMGYEILNNNLHKFNDKENLIKYINKGYHHIKLSLNSDKHINHIELVKYLLEHYPKQTKSICLQILSFSRENIEEILNYLVQFKTIIPLTNERAEFMLKLIIKRKEILMELSNEFN